MTVVPPLVVGAAPSLSELMKAAAEQQEKNKDQHDQAKRASEASPAIIARAVTVVATTPKQKQDHQDQQNEAHCLILLELSYIRLVSLSDTIRKIAPPPGHGPCCSPKTSKSRLDRQQRVSFGAGQRLTYSRHAVQTH